MSIVASMLTLIESALPGVSYEGFDPTGVR